MSKKDYYGSIAELMGLDKMRNIPKINILDAAYHRFINVRINKYNDKTYNFRQAVLYFNSKKYKSTKKRSIERLSEELGIDKKELYKTWDVVEDDIPLKDDEFNQWINRVCKRR